MAALSGCLLVIVNSSVNDRVATFPAVGGDAEIRDEAGTQLRRKGPEVQRYHGNLVHRPVECHNLWFALNPGGCHCIFPTRVARFE